MSFCNYCHLLCTFKTESLLSLGHAHFVRDIVFPKFSFQVSYPVEDELVITLGGFFVKTAAAVKFVKDELELTECCLFTEFFWFTWLTLSWEVEAEVVCKLLQVNFHQSDIKFAIFAIHQIIVGQFLANSTFKGVSDLETWIILHFLEEVMKI